MTIPPHFHTKMVVLTDKHCHVHTTTDNEAFELTYIKYPDRIDVSGETLLCTLSATLHDKIAELAAKIAIQVTEKERMSRQPQQQQKQQQ